MDFTLAELTSGFLCGGLVDEGTPDAELVADTLMSFDELIQEVRAAPGMHLQFDIKYQAGETLEAGVFAGEIVGRWRAAGRPNPWYASCSDPACIQAFRGEDADARLTWPEFPAGANTTVVAISSEVLSQLGLADPVGLASSAGATGLDAAYQVMERRLVEAARRRGMKTTLWTLNDLAPLETYCHWPVDVIISDYPERAPCR
jgi:glycerophosphoryl diester phosphodiesterase